MKEAAESDVHCDELTGMPYGHGLALTEFAPLIICSLRFEPFRHVAPRNDVQHAFASSIGLG
jgi:hypothetical protein